VTAGEAIGYGEEPTLADLQRAQDAAELTGTAALARVAANARATVGTVALVGTTLTGLGLVSAQSVLVDDLPRLFALAAAATAFAAVLTGLFYLALRVQQLNVNDLNAVGHWLQEQMDRAKFAVAASWLLILAVLLAGVAVGLALYMRLTDGADPALSLRLSGSGEDRVLGADVSVANLEPGEVVTARVVGVESGSCAEELLLQATSRADRTGTATATGTVEKLGCHETFQLVVLRDGEEPIWVAVP
jgi:hypothetical protein